MVALVGASGSGKSTLLHVLAGVDAPTAGRARVAGHDLLAMSRADRVRYRRHVVGFVRQQTARNLVPYLTAQPDGRPADDDRRRTPRASAATARPSCSRASAWRTAPTAGPRRCPAASSSGSRSRRARQPARGSCWPTSRPASSTARRRRRSSPRCAPPTASSAPPSWSSPTTPRSAARSSAPSRSATAAPAARCCAATTTGGRARARAEEYAVMDRAGRVQVPREYREALALTRRVRLALGATTSRSAPTAARTA